MIIGIDGNEANVRNRVGANQYAFELLRALHSLPEAKKHQWIIYLREKPLPDMPQLSTWWNYKVFGPRHFWTQLALPLSLKLGKRPLDVFFSPGHYRPRWSPVPTAVSIMDLGYLQFPDQFARRDLLQLTHWTKRSIQKANHILAISESTKEDIMKYYKISGEKITVTYPGYDKKRFHARLKVQKEILEKYGIKGDYLLFLSTLKPSKNLEGLLEAFRLLDYRLPSTDYGNMKLVIAGKKGWLYGKIFAKVKELGLTDKVIFTDFVDEKDKPTIIVGARVLVSPSFWEGFGIHLVEAMACGCPVVAGNVGSVPEVLEKAGVLVDPKRPQTIADGIQKVLNNRETYAKRGLERARAFDWKKTAEQTFSVLVMTAKKKI